MSNLWPRPSNSISGVIHHWIESMSSVGTGFWTMGLAMGLQWLKSLMKVPICEAHL